MALVLWVDNYTKNKLFDKYVINVLNNFAITFIITKVGDFSKVQPDDVVLCFGVSSLNFLSSLKIIPKNRTITSLRGNEYFYKNIPILITWHPFVTSKDYSKISEIYTDIKLALRTYNTGSIYPVLGDYNWVAYFTNTIKAIKELYIETGKKVPVSLDLETVGLVPYVADKYIVSISITYKKDQASLVYFKSPNDQPIIANYVDGVVKNHTIINFKLAQEINWLLTSDIVLLRGANLKYDFAWLMEKWDLYCTNYTFDTLLVGSLLDENRSNSLTVHAHLYTDMGGYDTELNNNYDKSRMDLIPKGDLLDYAGGDTDVCYQVSQIFTKKIMKNKSLTNFYKKLLHPASRVFETVEQRGMYVDLPEFKRLEQEVKAYLNNVEIQALSLLPNKLRIKYRDNLHLTRSAIIKDYMFTSKGLNLTPKIKTPKSKEPSTAMEHLTMFADNPDAGEFIKLLSDFNSAKKTLGTYIVGFMKHLRPDGKFHPSYFLFVSGFGGTNTGRTSVKDPAFQTIPHHTKWANALRKVYIAPPGYVILSVDYSQGELRVAACVADETNMVELYKTGVDMHAATGSEVFGITLDDFFKLPKAERKPIRQGGKAGNFGLIYGMSAFGFQTYARQTYGVDLSLDHCDEFRDKFLYNLYPKLPIWHNNYKQFALKNFYVPSPLGRVRHLPLVHSVDREVQSKQLRQAVNAPIQATLSDLTQFSMVNVDEQYPNIHMFGMCHDAIYAYIPEDNIPLWAGRFIDIMENLPLEKTFGWKPQLKFEAEAEAGVNLADCEELSL
jgi:DNA polymerase I-like protein with 3'-5' exonuclease and polymerase domains